MKLTKGENDKHFILHLRKLHVFRALETTQILQKKKNQTRSGNDMEVKLTPINR